MSMDTSTNSNFQIHQVEFKGDGFEYFKIMIVNWLFTVLTVGLYYPWARAKKLKYIYSHTEINNESFHFSGTGKEMFIGFIKVLAIYFTVMLLIYAGVYYFQEPMALLLVYLFFIAIIPIAIHGSFKYRMSRSSYRGIRFGYRGSRKELCILFFKGIILTIITFGIYGFWLSMNITKYTHSHIRYGDVEFNNNSDGSEFFKLYIVGYILTILTMGIYSFWWASDLYNYTVNRNYITKGEKELFLYAETTGADMFKLKVGNFFIIVFTLGLGTAWADMRSKRYLTNSICLQGDINLDSIHQTEEEYTNAFGEDAIDFFDLDVV